MGWYETLVSSSHMANISKSIFLTVYIFISILMISHFFNKSSAQATVLYLWKGKLCSFHVSVYTNSFRKKTTKKQFHVKTSKLFLFFACTHTSVLEKLCFVWASKLLSDSTAAHRPLWPVCWSHLTSPHGGIEKQKTRHVAAAGEKEASC